MTKRDNFLKRLNTFEPELIVIGGGITGAGIFLDAQSRGINTLLIEKQDFASGTSSRSTKLIHGGLRYLKQLDFGLVRKTGIEREIVSKIAPHITRKINVKLPITKKGSLSKFSTNIALSIYERLSLVPFNERHKYVDKSRLVVSTPIKEDGLIGAFDYLEYKTEDSRLVIEIIKKGCDLGGIALNYAELSDFEYENDKISGIVFQDRIRNTQKSIKCSNAISACGPWVDDVCRLEDNTKPDKLTLTKGVHLVFKKSDLPIQDAFYFDTQDKRMIFVIPENDIVYAGTTDTLYTENKNEPRCTQEDVDYLLENINNRFNVDLNDKHIISSWTGLRPLISQKGKSPSEISRKDEIFVSPTGLYSIAGGKLTGYRLMAEKILNKLIKDRGIQCESCWTDELQISGGEFNTNDLNYLENRIIEKGIENGISKDRALYMFSKFGKNAFEIFNNIKMFSDFFAKYEAPTCLLAALQYCIDGEFILTPTDFAIRRMGLLYYEPEILEKHKKDIVDYMGERLKWTDEKKQYYLEDLEKEIYYSKNFD